MRYLPLINLNYLAFSSQKLTCIRSTASTLFTEDACVACAAVSRSVSLRVTTNLSTDAILSLLNYFPRTEVIIYYMSLYIIMKLFSMNIDTDDIISLRNDS